jgi:hypothetical protein
MTSLEQTGSNDSMFMTLTYLAGEHPLITPLPYTPDDGFLDSHFTCHMRLPSQIHDLDYVIHVIRNFWRSARSGHVCCEYHRVWILKVQVFW